MKFKKTIILLLLAAAAVFTVAYTTGNNKASLKMNDSGANALNNTENKSMTQIHSEEGIPVNVKTVKKGSFHTVLNYTSTVTGITESSKFSSVSDTVDQVLFSVGDFVKKDTVLITFPKNNPSANYYQAKASYQNAADSFKRMESLYKTKGVSKQNYDDAKTGLEVARANWEIVNNMLEVKAPISGYITRIDVRPSENVEPEDHLVTVSNYDLLKAKIQIPEREINRIKTGMRATASWEGYTVEGIVVQTDLSLNPKTNSFGAVLEFDNNNHLIRSGVTTEISIETYKTTDAIVVEKKNILSKNNKDCVFVAENNIAVKREIKTGSRQGLDVEITEGLKVGDILITEGNRLVSDGSKIRIATQENWK